MDARGKRRAKEDNNSDMVIKEGKGGSNQAKGVK